MHCQRRRYTHARDELRRATLGARTLVSVPIRCSCASVTCTVGRTLPTVACNRRSFQCASRSPVTRCQTAIATPLGACLDWPQLRLRHLTAHTNMTDSARCANSPQPVDAVDVEVGGDLAQHNVRFVSQARAIDHHLRNTPPVTDRQTDRQTHTTRSHAPDVVCLARTTQTTDQICMDTIYSYCHRPPHHLYYNSPLCEYDVVFVEPLVSAEKWLCDAVK
jgi:hypothetical protein